MARLGFRRNLTAERHSLDTVCNVRRGRSCGAELAVARRLRKALWRQVDPEAYERDGLSPTNRVVVWIVALSSILAILETEPTVEDIAPRAFDRLESIFAVLFLAEYLVRLWAEGENPKFRGIRGRIRYAFTPAAIIDLIAFLASLILPVLRARRISCCCASSGLSESCALQGSVGSL